MMTFMQQLSLTLKYPIKSILQHNILWQLTVCISNYGILSRTMQEVFEIFLQYLVVGKNKYKLNVVELPWFLQQRLISRALFFAFSAAVENCQYPIEHF
ncbi:hypothetical protein [Oscillibacter sp. MSJ-31]|uniref:hypothetical protein n=1 Tax=Oscillibacter sp. MSJ-31 TaxID=2841526 RepID=UPI001C108555|nr:hypothetical protein [Oscillibacter sp. MSJ-31]MBU5458687.1 hypothetical protein [Oscillibacter sp. MSJ-31]